MTTTMDLRDALTLHQLTLASEGRTEKTQRQYRHFQTVFLRYLESARIAPSLASIGLVLVILENELNFCTSTETPAWQLNRP